MFEAAGLFLEQFLDVLAAQSAIDYSDLVARAVIEADRAPRRAARRVRPRLRRRVPGHRPQPGRAPAPDRRRRAQPHRRRRPDQSIYGFRGAEVRGILDFPREFPRADGAPAEVVALGTTRRFGSRLLAVSRRVAGRIAAQRRDPGRGVRAVPCSRGRAGHRLATAGSTCSPSTPSAPRSSTSPTCCVAPTSRTASPGSEMAVLVRSGRASIPPLRRALAAAGVPVEVARDEVPLVREPAVVPLLDALRARGRPRGRRPPRTPTSSTPTGSRPCSSLRSAASTRPTCAASPAASQRARRRHRSVLAAAGPARGAGSRRTSTGRGRRGRRQGRRLARLLATAAERRRVGRDRRGRALGAVVRHRAGAPGCARLTERGGHAARLRPP